MFQNGGNFMLIKKNLIVLSCIMAFAVALYAVLGALAPKAHASSPAETMFPPEATTPDSEINPAAGETQPAVYFTSNINPAGLMAVYEALGMEAKGKVAVKLHSGAPGNPYFLSPNLIKNLVQKINGTIVECNTVPGGGRATAVLH
jgi:uncharacterized protein